MTSLRKMSRYFSCSLLVSILILLLPVLVFSEEPEEIVPPCFTGSELEKVREWEKTWAGKKVNYQNVEQVKDFLPDFYFQMMKEPKKWGTSDLWFEVVPYRYCLRNKGFLEAIKKHSPLTKLDPKGFKTPWGEVGPDEYLIGYDKGETAGYPFPKPKTGLEMAWNFDSNTSGDNSKSAVFGEVVNCRTGAERHAYQPTKTMYWTGRTSTLPIPKIENNPKGIRMASALTIIEPVDMFGTNYLNIRYTDPRKEDDTYIWIAMYRRIRRMSTTERNDSIDGSDASYRDGGSYSGHINRNTYKFLEVKDMLACRHQDGDKLVKVKGQAMWSGQQRERCKIYLVAVTDKDPGRVYSKELWYMDGETWHIPYKECWDLQGRLWRALDSQLGYKQNIRGEPITCQVGYNTTDQIRLHGCPNQSKEQEFGIELSPDIFTVKYIQRTGY